MDPSDHNKNAAPEMPPAFKEFFDKALPKDGGYHTVVLGEAHVSAEHLSWLITQLPELKHRGITTIGIEKPPWFNLFLWAYQDGTLERVLGSHSLAKNYVHAACLASVRKDDMLDCSINADALANLLIQAMDAGIRIVAYDGRATLGVTQNNWDKEIAEWNHHIENNSENQRISKETTLHKLRTNPDKLLNIARSHIDISLPWLTSEVKWLGKQHPEYNKKLTTLEHLVTIGHQKIGVGKLTSDALSATIFHAMAADGHRLTIGGAGHISGLRNVGRKIPEHHPKQVHGTFGHHLFAVGSPSDTHRPHRVTSAVIGTTTTKRLIDNEIQLFFNHKDSRMVQNHAVPLLNLDTGNVEEIWHPPHDDPRVVPLTEKFPQYSRNPMGWLNAITVMQADHTAAHINPLRMPDIKAAAAVRARMNGESIDRYR